MGWVLAFGAAAAAWWLLRDDSEPPPSAGAVVVPPELRPYTRTSVNLDNDPPPEVWAALARTRELYLEWFEPLATFTSAYRSAAVNGAVGSELGTRSAHVWGRGLDLVPRPGIGRGLLVAQVIAARAAGAIGSWVDELDHIHVEW